MKNRKLTRFLSLSAACILSLCLGAYLSYQAASHEEVAIEQAAQATEQAVTPSSDLAQAPVAAAETREAESSTVAANLTTADSDAAPEAASLLRVSLGANREQDAPPVLAYGESDGQKLDLRVTEPAPETAAPQSAPSPNPEPPQAAAEPAPALPPASFAPGKPVPLPPARPSSLCAAVVPPAPAAPAGTAPPAPAAAQVVARLEPSANPASIPAVSDALAAVSASVGGANATLAPRPQAEPTAAPNVGVSEVAPGQPTAFKRGSQVFIRIFKQEGALEVWMKQGERFGLYKSFPICKWSGKLGPKTKQADYQSPEGFYSVSARQLNPHSHYHLAFDVGYPNAYDRRQGATGSLVMVHGDCKSVGCFAMTNAGIDEIYGYVSDALANGQHEVPVHIFPFRMTEEAIARETSGPNSFLAFLDNGGEPKRDWGAFWRNLKQGYDIFERTHVPPVAYACGDRYDFGATGAACSRIAGW